MPINSQSYSDGKFAELQTWEYLRRAGFVRPSPYQRLNIKAAFSERGVEIHSTAFDALLGKTVGIIDSPLKLRKGLDKLLLFEVKTSGTRSKTKVSAGFNGLGFTLTIKEHHNATVLGAQYRFLFVSLRTLSHRHCLLSDFFSVDRARIYQTWSVFLKTDLPLNGEKGQILS
jgi:hypothetical protein